MFTFLIGQVFLSILCAMKWGTFLFFAGFVLIMTIFVILAVPETKVRACGCMAASWFRLRCVRAALVLNLARSLLLQQLLQGVPIEEISEVIANKHWLWSRVVAGAPREDGGLGEKPVVAKSVV